MAELLIEVSSGNASVKRRIRLELASAQSPAEVGKEVRKRLTTIARSRSFVDSQIEEAWSMISKRSAVRFIRSPRQILPKVSN